MTDAQAKQMQLFNTKIIPATEDALWSLPLELPDFDKIRVLIFSSPFQPGSAEEATLKKIMAACKLQESDFAVIQMQADEKISWQLLSGAGAPKSIILFGILPAQLGINALFVLNAANSFLDCTFIPSFGLSQIEMDKELKRSLWENALKPHFLQ